MQVIELQVLAACAQLQRQLAGEWQRAVHDGQIHRHFAGIVARDRIGDGGDGGIDGRTVDQQIGLGQGLGNGERGHQAVVPKWAE